MTQTPTLSQSKTAAQPAYEITDKDRQRVRRIARAWQAYNGDLEKPLMKTPEGLDANVMSNRCVGVVDGGVNFLFGKELEISVEEDAPDDAQDFLESVWGSKEQRIPLLQKLEMNGAIAGTAVLRIVPGPARPGQPQKFRLITVDPATVYVQYAPQDCETVLLYCIEYCTTETINGKPEQVYYREEIQRIDPDGNALREQPDDDDTWQIQHWTRVGQKGDWQAAGDPIAWNYPFPPIFACQNMPNPNDFWGRPDITDDIIDMNQALNITQSCINLILVRCGLGLLYASGAGEGVIDYKPGQIIQFENVDAKIVAVGVPNDIPSALNFAEDLRSDIDEQSHVPGVATGRIKDMPRGNVSGVAIELMYQPLLNKTHTKQCLYGEMIIDASQALLVLAGYSSNIDVSLAWQSPLPKDDLPGIQAAVALEEVGVSLTTRQRDLGYDPEEEAKLRQSETEQALRASKDVSVPLGLPPGMPGAPNLPGQMYPPPAPAQAPGQSGGEQGGQGQ